MLDIRQMPAVVEIVNAILNNRGIAEVKVEKSGVSVVEIKRTLKTAKPDKKQTN